MSNEIELWYEFASTYSYPAVMRSEAVARANGFRISWKPFLLGPIFRDLGWATSPFNLQPAKGTYMWRDLERICSKLNLPFSKPATFPQNGLKAARIATAIEDQTARGAFTRSVFTSQFGNGQDISVISHLITLLANCAVDTDQVLERSASQTIKDTLRNNTDTARAYGIFGAPTWRTPDGELFWGNDRLEDALHWATTNQ